MIQKESSIQILLSILGVISLILITVGVSFAFFTYEKELHIENNLNDGKLSLIYTENTYSERGISIVDLTSFDDSLGKTLYSDKYIFDFRIVGDSSKCSDIPYEITLRKEDFSILDEEYVKVYLTELKNGKEIGLVSNSGSVRTFDMFNQTEIISSDEMIEKTIYSGVIPADTKNYEKKFRLRVWVSDNIKKFDTSLLEKQENIPYFKVSLNAYANTKTVTRSESVEASSISFSDVSPMVIGGTQEVQINFEPITTTDKSLEWSSSDPTVISVTSLENGKAILKALNNGTSTIDVKTSNGLTKSITVDVGGLNY